MGKRRDTTAANGEHWSTGRGKRPRSSRPIAYQNAHDNPVAGLELAGGSGHRQTRLGNTMNNRHNGGGTMYYRQREGWGQ